MTSEVLTSEEEVCGTEEELVEGGAEAELGLVETVVPVSVSDCD